jgi:hypothetical protein
MPPARAVTSLSMTRAAAASENRIDIACAADEDDFGLPFTRLLRCDGGAWSTVDIEEHAESLCHFRDALGKASLWMLARNGNLVDVDGGGAVTKVFDPTLHGKPHQLGFLSKVRAIGTSLYAVGAGAQTYRRAGDGAWHVLSEELLDGPFPDPGWLGEYLRDPDLLKNPEANRQMVERVLSEKPTLFWALAGTSESSIYFGGEQRTGLLYGWDGSRARRCNLPTEKAIRNIVCAPDGTVWVCGREGVLLTGRGLDFEVTVDVTGHQFGSMAWFDGRLYVCVGFEPSTLYVLDGNTLKPVATGLSPEMTDAHVLESAGGALWAVGWKSLARFDGHAWERIPVPGVDAQP